MAIPGQANINIANTPNDPVGSDSLYTAFNTIQNNFTSLFSASSPITNITAGQGISVSNATSASYQIVNTGVTSLIAGNNITITSSTGTPGSNGALIISSTGGNGSGGGVTSVGVASNTLSVTNTPIISTGNIAINLANVANLTPGTYTNPNVVVDGYGRITTIANGVSVGVTSVSVSANGSGLSISGSPITGASGNNTGAGTIQITNTGVTSLIAGTGIVLSGNTGAVTISSTGGGGGGTGTVTSVGVASNTLTVTGSPVVSAGTINVEIPSTLGVNVLNANTVNSPTVNSNTINITANNVQTLISTQYTNTANADSVIIRRGRGNPGVPSQALTGDNLLSIRSQGYTNFNIFQNSGGLNVVANGAPANSSSLVPSDVILNATTTTDPVSFKFQHTGNMVVPGALTTTVFSNSAPVTTHVATRSRGTSSSVSSITTGDYLYRLLALGQTGNGTSTVNDIAGYSYGGGVEVVAAGVPGSSGAYVPSNVVIRSISTSNAQNILNFTSTGNLEVPGIILGNGSGLSSLTGANVSGTVPLASVAGTVSGASQSNITSVGTLTGLTSGGVINFTSASNVSLGNLSNIKILGGSSGYTIKTDGAGNLTWGIDTTAAAGSNTQVQFNNGGSLGASANLVFDQSLNTLTLAGNIVASNANLGNNATANFFSGNGVNLFGIAGANVTGQVANALVAGAVYTAAQPSITSVGTLTGLEVSGNVTAANITANTGVFTGNAAGLSNIPGANVTGTVANATYSTSAGSATTAGTVTTASQSNITSVGTLISLDVSGNITAANITANTGVFTGNAAGLTYIPAANLNGNVNNNISVSVTANTTNTVGNIVSITINGTTYQLLAR
jgi:hypothetical protein